MAPGAHNPVNVDCQIMELVRRRMENNPTRFVFDEAKVNTSMRFAQFVKCTLILCLK